MKTRHLLFVSALLTCATATAGTFTWTNLSGGSFATPGNWSAAPTFASDDVLDFSTLNITGSTKVLTLDANRTAGTLKFGDTTASNDWTVSPGTPSTSKITLSTTSGTPTINVVNQTTNFGVVIDGTQGFEKIGGGTLALTAANTYTGITTISAGQIQLKNSNGLGSSAAGSGTTLAAGTSIYLLSGAETSTISEQFTINGASSIRAGNGVAYTLGGTTTLNAGLTFNTDSGATIIHSGASGVITGNGSLTKDGAGTLTLSGANSYIGATGVTAGVLKLAKSNSLNQYNNVTVNSGATLALITGDGTTGWSQAQIDTMRGTSGFTLSSGSVLSFDTGTNGDFTYATSITGSPGYGISKIGTGALTLTGTNTYTGGTALVAGTLNINNNSALGTGTLTITKGAFLANTSGGLVTIANNITGANLTLNGSGDLTTTGTVTYTSDRSIFVNGAGVLTVGSIAGASSLVLVKQGAGTLAITGAAGANVNGVDIRAGTLVIGNKDSLGANAFRFNNTAGGTLQTSVNLTGANKLANAVDVGIAGNISGSFDLELGGVLSGAAALSKLGSGSLIISGGSNTHSGGLLIKNGSVILDGGNNRLLATSGVTIGDVATSGKLVLGGASSISQTLATLGSTGLTGSVVGGNASTSTLTVSSASSSAFAGKIGGAGTNENNIAVVKDGTGTWTLSGANTYSGGTAVKAGVLSVGNSSAFGGGDVTLGVTGSASQILLSNGVDVTNKLIINANSGIGGNGILRVDALNGAAVWSGAIEVNATPGSGSVFMTANNATLTVSGYITAVPALANFGQRDGKVTYSGGGNYTNFILYQGLSKVGADNGMSTTALMTLGNTGTATLDLNGFNQAYDGVVATVPANSTVTNSAATASVLTLGASTNRTYAGVITNGTGGVSLVKQGNSVLTLSGANTYAGATTIKAGTLTLDATGTIANSSSIIVGDAGSSGAVLDVSAKTGGFNIGSGQKLGGIGTVDANNGVTKYTVTIDLNGIHAPGNSPGAQTVDGNLSYASGSIFQWDLAANKDTNGLDDNIGTIGDNGVAGTDYDAVTVTGNLSINSAAVFQVIQNSGVNFSNAFWSANQTWSNIFSVTGTTTSDWNDTSVSVYNTSNALQDVSTYGQFSITGATLNWTAVPEPTSALIGILMGAGMLVRRRTRQ